MNIYEKLANIWKNVQRMAKDDKVEFGKTAYKALSEEKVTTIMRQQMVEHGLIVYPVEMVSSRNGQLSHVDVRYRIVNVESPDEYIEVVSCGDGADTQDKGAGKAMTYAYKYMWLRTFGIPTGEDPDKISSAQLDAEEAERQKAIVPCSDCACVIEPSKKRDGSIWSAADMVKWSSGRFGRPLCAECMKKAMAAEKKAEKIAAAKSMVANYAPTLDGVRQ